WSDAVRRNGVPGEDSPGEALDDQPREDGAMAEQPSDPFVHTGIDTTVAHSARVWNYWLGGKDNYAVDREVGDAWMAVYPEIVQKARESRAFLRRVVRFLAGEAGVRQFLDIGTGLPT